MPPTFLPILPAYRYSVHAHPVQGRIGPIGADILAEYQAHGLAQGYPGRRDGAVEWAQKGIDGTDGNQGGGSILTGFEQSPYHAGPGGGISREAREGRLRPAIPATGRIGKGQIDRAEWTGCHATQGDAKVSPGPRFASRPGCDWLP